VISKAIHEDCQRRNKNLSIAWIDYQKAFNSIPLSWVEESTEFMEVNSKIVRFYRLLLEKCNNASLKTKQEGMLLQPIQVVTAISKDFNMNFGLEKCARICLKKDRVQSKIYIGSAFEMYNKEVDPREAYRYLGIEESHDMQQKNEKEKL
jgi:hypothetical protein